MLDGRMTLSYHSLDFSVPHVGGRNKHSTRPKARSWSSALSSKPSAILLQTNRTGNLSEPRSSESSTFPTGSASTSPVLSLANTLGVIGGVSPVSTLSFLEKLVKRSLGESQGSIPFIVCNDPVLNSELSTYARSSYAYLNSKKNHDQFDPSVIVENLRHKRLFLERSGARCIVMPCHISHVWYNEVSKGCSVPFLHAGECVAKELKAAKFKPIEAGSNLRIGILATDVILTSGFYQEKLKSLGFEVLLPDKATMEHTVIPAVEAFARKDMEGARNLMRIALQVLLVRAVNTVILASDEMHGLLPQGDPLLKKCTDPMDALVRSTVQWATSTEVNK